MLLWQLPTNCQDSIQKLARRFNLHPVVAGCLLSRLDQNMSGEWDEEEIEIILEHKEFPRHDPFLFKGMDIAVDRILKAVERKEKICVFGDYDADGVTATAILLQAFDCLGADVFYFIPDRFGEGVGLTCKRIDDLVINQGTKLIITVDTGSRCIQEAQHARDLGVDLIITDHHLPSDPLPDSLAFINPKSPDSGYPFPDLCGAGVAYKLVEALKTKCPQDIQLGEYQKIAAIGTIADMVPLRGENRWLVKQGLREISRETKGPLRTLLRKLGIKNRVFSQDISYKIAPRVNAPGRLGDPDTAISFFLGKGAAHETARIVEIMEGMNHIRQMLERELETRLDMQTRSISNSALPPFILLAGKNWHRGILGITACKMLRKYSRPVCVLSYNSEEANGSLRGLPGVNLIDKLTEIESLFTSFGGHAEAAGVSLDVTNLPQFKKRMSELLASEVEQSPYIQVCNVDAELDWSELNHGFFKQLMKLEPFGSGNGTPVFMSQNLILESELQRHGPWISFEASDGNTHNKCSYYHPDSLKQDFEKYDSIDLVYSIIPFRDDYQIQVSQMRLS